MKYSQRFLLLIVFFLGWMLPEESNAQFFQQGKKLVGKGAIGKAELGFSVALSADGNTAIVGGPVTAVIGEQRGCSLGLLLRQLKTHCQSQAKGVSCP